LQGITAAAREGRFFVGVLLVLLSFFQCCSKQQTQANTSNFRSVRVFCLVIPCSALTAKRKHGPFLFVSAMVLLFSPSGSAHNTAAGRATRSTRSDGSRSALPAILSTARAPKHANRAEGSAADRAPCTSRDTDRHSTRCRSDTTGVPS